MGEYDLAVEDLSKAIEINPGHGKAYFNRASVYEKLGKSDLAEKDLKKAKEAGLEF